MLLTRFLLGATVKIREEEKLACVRVILVIMASMIFSPFVGYGFLRCS